MISVVIAPRRWPLVKQDEDEFREAIAWAKAHPDSDKKPSAAAVPADSAEDLVPGDANRALRFQIVQAPVERPQPATVSNLRH